jgi:trans-aconitate 2-methyltransferase
MKTNTRDYVPTPSRDRWDAKLYDGHHGYVSNLGKDVLELLDPKTGEQILDLGCGTGHLTYQITESGARVVGIDRAKSAIEVASRAYPQLNFEVGNVEDLDWIEQFDAVFSNAVLHWVKPPEQVIQKVWHALKPGGRFVAEFGGQGNVGAIVRGLCEALDEAGYPENKSLNPWYFPSIVEYGKLLETRGFQLRSAQLFDRPTPLDDGKNGLRNWLEMFAGAFFESISAAEKRDILDRVEMKLYPTLFRHGVWIADYRRIRIVALKPEGC